MLDDTIRRIEAAIRRIETSRGKEKAELLALLESLKAEVRELSRTRLEHARSIAGLTEQAAHEATRTDPSPGLLRHSLDGLELAAEELGASHPRLVAVLDDLASMLARIGI